MSLILVSEAVAGKAIDQLKQEPDLNVVFEPVLWKDPSALAQAVGEADAIIVRNQTQVTADLIAAAPKLKIIARAGAGLDNIDTEAATAAGIVVSFAPNENSLSVAELAMGLFLSLARKIPSANQDIRDGNWNRSMFTGSELFGKNLGIVGIGRIGTLVGQRAKAFGMKLLAHDNFVDQNGPQYQELEVSFVELDELLEQSDFITVHLPLLPTTRAMFNKERFAKMKPSAFFVNTSRGEVADENALANALANGVIAGAGLDVRAIEPPAAGDHLVEAKKAVLTPHIAAFTHEAQERVVAAVCRDSAAVLRGQDAEGFFNFARPKREPDEHHGQPRI